MCSKVKGIQDWSDSIEKKKKEKKKKGWGVDLFIDESRRMKGTPEYDE